MHRRAFLTSSLALIAGGCSSLTESEIAEVEKLGEFKIVLGRPGIVVSAPHGTTDPGSFATAIEIRDKVDAGGVFVNGFWLQGFERNVRINVNRNTEQSGGLQSYTARSAHINARYTALVREAARGPLEWFFEIHTSQIQPPKIVVATGRVTVAEAKLFKEFFHSARDRLLPSEAPKLEIQIEPLDYIAWLSYQGSSSISEFSRKGFLIECPYVVMGNKSIWRKPYGEVLADVIENMVRASA